MNTHTTWESSMHSEERPTDIPTPPPLDVVAFFVRSCRTLKNWKVSTLADFASVSVSTVERVERGEKVSEEALDKIAMALGREKGAFYVPRIPLDPEKAFEVMAETYGNLTEVAVSPMNSQRAIREAAKCDGILIHRPDVPDIYDDEISNLREWIDLASFVLCDEIECGDAEPSRRQLYNDILNYIAELERRGLTVLSGVMSSNAPEDGNLKVAIISVTPKISDPGAVKRTAIFVDRRLISRSNTTFPDFD